MPITHTTHFAGFVQSFDESVLPASGRERRNLYHFTKINLNQMDGKVWNTRPIKRLRKSWRQIGRSPIIKPQNIRWLEPLALLLLFGLLLGLVWLALS